MRQFRKFWQLPARDQRFLIKCASLLGLIRLGLWLLPFPTLRRLLTKMSQPINANSVSSQWAINRITWAVAITSRYIPHASCLTQALAVQLLLSRRGYPADLRIGVATKETGQLEAHAWVESEGQIVIGGVDSPRRYTPFPSLERKSL